MEAPRQDDGAANAERGRVLCQVSNVIGRVGHGKEDNLDVLRKEGHGFEQCISHVMDGSCCTVEVHGAGFGQGGVWPVKVGKDVQLL